MLGGSCARAEEGNHDVAKNVDWVQVLSASQGALPQPRPEVVWGDDLQKAMAEARRENRPVFVTLRCLPCKQCSSFDKDVLEGSADLSPLLRHFMTVRLTDAKAMDLRYLPAEGFQDLDISWWGYFLSPEGKVYGIFGGKDHVSDSTRISEAALVNTLRRVLAHHYDPKRAAWDVDGPAPAPDAPAKPPTQLPGYEPWVRKANAEVKNQACLHCHQVAEVLREPAISAGAFDRKKDTQVWPLPENVGIELERDHGLLVTTVAEGSPAAKAGMKPGDVLAAAGGRKLFGQADFRGVLHRGPKGAGSIPLVWLRGGKPTEGELEVCDGWRQTVLDWRMSIAQGNIGADVTFFPLAASKNERAAAGAGETSMAVKPFLYKEGAAAKAGLKPHHIIVAVNGESPDVSGRAFQWWFRQRFDAGGRVVLTVKEGPATREIAFELPKG